ncbi:MAG: hypothetical protein ABJ084_07455 [Halioglobus sp.]
MTSTTLSEHSEQMAMWKDTPDMDIGAAKELIRWTSPVRHMVPHGYCGFRSYTVSRLSLVTISSKTDKQTGYTPFLWVG